MFLPKFSMLRTLLRNFENRSIEKYIYPRVTTMIENLSDELGRPIFNTHTNK